MSATELWFVGVTTTGSSASSDSDSDSVTFSICILFPSILLLRLLSISKRALPPAPAMGLMGSSGTDCKRTLWRASCSRKEGDWLLLVAVEFIGECFTAMRSSATLLGLLARALRFLSGREEKDEEEEFDREAAVERVGFEKERSRGIEESLKLVIFVGVLKGEKKVSGRVCVLMRSSEQLRNIHQPHLKFNAENDTGELSALLKSASSSAEGLFL